MILEKGVEIKELCANLIKILPIVSVTFYEAGSHMVVIATKWGRDPFRFPHEHGHALDVLAPIKNIQDIFYKVKTALGFNYKVLYFKTHFHVEYSPLGDKPLPRLSNRKFKINTMLV